MPTLTLKVTAEFQRRLKRVARQRQLPVSEVVRAAVEKELPKSGKGWLLGSMRQYSLGPSTYDPAKPAFDESEWEHLEEK
ncbi:MAG: hypothetical protein WDM96_09005 [Lacunisphaera sp.]